MYTFETKELEKLGGKTKANLHSTNRTDLRWWITTLLLLLLTLTSAIVLIRYRRRIKTLQEEISYNSEQPFTKHDVIRYISDNLPSVSLNAINMHFETNSTQVYTILEPEKPGALIQQMRLEKVMEMRKGGARAREISLVTGLSESYIRKIWNKD